VFVAAQGFTPAAPRPRYRFPPCVKAPPFATPPQPVPLPVRKSFFPNDLTATSPQLARFAYPPHTGSLVPVLFSMGRPSEGLAASPPGSLSKPPFPRGDNSVAPRSSTVSGAPGHRLLAFHHTPNEVFVSRVLWFRVW